jgi:hypothetical protein
MLINIKKHYAGSSTKSHSVESSSKERTTTGSEDLAPGAPDSIA